MRGIPPGLGGGNTPTTTTPTLTDRMREMKSSTRAKRGRQGITSQTTDMIFNAISRHDKSLRFYRPNHDAKGKGIAELAPHLPYTGDAKSDAKLPNDIFSTYIEHTTAVNNCLDGLQQCDSIMSELETSGFEPSSIPKSVEAKSNGVIFTLLEQKSQEQKLTTAERQRYLELKPNLDDAEKKDQHALSQNNGNLDPADRLDAEIKLLQAEVKKGEQGAQNLERNPDYRRFNRKNLTRKEKTSLDLLEEKERKNNQRPSKGPPLTDDDKAYKRELLNNGQEGEPLDPERLPQRDRAFYTHYSDCRRLLHLKCQQKTDLHLQRMQGHLDELATLHNDKAANTLLMQNENVRANAGFFKQLHEAVSGRQKWFYQRWSDASFPDATQVEFKNPTGKVGACTYTEVEDHPHQTRKQAEEKCKEYEDAGTPCEIVEKTQTLQGRSTTVYHIKKHITDETFKGISRAQLLTLVADFNAQERRRCESANPKLTYTPIYHTERNGKIILHYKNKYQRRRFFKDMKAPAAAMRDARNNVHAQATMAKPQRQEQKLEHKDEHEEKNQLFADEDNDDLVAPEFVGDEKLSDDEEEEETGFGLGFGSTP